MENQDTNITVNNVDISKINELIEKESGFIDLLNMEIGKVIIGQKHMVESLLINVLYKVLGFVYDTNSKSLHHTLAHLFGV